MTSKDYNGRMWRTNGSVAVRLSLAAGVLLILLAGATKARDPNNLYSEYNVFLRDFDKFWIQFQIELGETSAFDAIGAYHSMALLALGSKDGTRRELLEALNYCIIDNVITSAALLNKTIPTYSQFKFESYIDLSKEAELDDEFDRMLTQYIPLVVKRKSDKLCKSCGSRFMTQVTQQVCFTSYSDYKVDWAKQFDPKHTSQMTFTYYDKSTENVTIMYRTGLALYKDDKDRFKMQMLTVPFASKDSFLLLAKSNDGTNIFDFAKKIQGNLDSVIKNVMFQQAPTNVKMGLPKFKYTTNIDVINEDIFKYVTKIFSLSAETAILKNYLNSNINYYNIGTEFEINEEGINYKAKTVAGNTICDVIPERETPTLKKSDVQSPYKVAEIVSLVDGIVNETLEPVSETTVEFNGASPFLYFVITTDLTVLSAGMYMGNNIDD